MVDTVRTSTLIDSFAFNDVEDVTCFSLQQNASWAVRGYFGTADYSGPSIVLGNDPSDPGTNPITDGTNYSYLGGYGPNPIRNMPPGSDEETTEVYYNRGRGYYQFIGGSEASDQSAAFQVLKSTALVRQTFWSVVYSCRGMIDLLNYKSVASSQTSAYIPYIIKCQIGATNPMPTPDHTGTYAIIAQTPHFYLDEHGSIYQKSTGQYLGLIATLNATYYGSMSWEILQLQKAWSG